MAALCSVAAASARGCGKRGVRDQPEVTLLYHLVRPTLTISGIRGPLQLWKTPSRLSFDGVLGSRSARHRRCSRRRLVGGGCCGAPGGGLQRASQLGSFVRLRSLSLGWTADTTLQDASEPMPPASLLQASHSAFVGSCGINLWSALPAASALARWCRCSARSVVPAASGWKRSAHVSGA